MRKIGAFLKKQCFDCFLCINSWSQSYDFRFCNYNASVVVGRLERFSK
jgi:hypothetical protein